MNGNTNSQHLAHFCLWVENLNAEITRLRKLDVEFLPKNNEAIYHVKTATYVK